VACVSWRDIPASVELNLTIVNAIFIIYFCIDLYVSAKCCEVFITLLR
jgi:hypothetical protein